MLNPSRNLLGCKNLRSLSPGLEKEFKKIVNQLIGIPITYHSNIKKKIWKFFQDNENLKSNYNFEFRKLGINIFKAKP